MKFTTETIGEGIYFGMPENVYHATPWCGSSNIKQLYSSPPDYWFDSHMNPLREVEEESFAQTFGKALHDRILYGEAVFKRKYQPLKGGTATGGLSADELKEWLKANGAAPAKTKAENERMVAEQFGINLLGEKTYEKIMVSAQMIVKNPHLEQAFSGGWPEVSVFWNDDGVPCKARFDYWKRKAIVDLKSFRSKDRIRSLDEWILQDLFNYRYDVQVAHYLAGHKAAARLFTEGKVFVSDGAARPDDAWLKSALAGPAHWVFVFYKADGMPLSKSYQINHGTPAHDCGNHARRLALDNYRDNLEKFGTDAWVNMDEPYEITEENIPKWL